MWYLAPVAAFLLITMGWVIYGCKLPKFREHPIPTLVLIGVVFVGINLLWPLTINRTVNTVQVVTQQVKVETFKVQKPSGVKYPPLTDPNDACKGKPVVIVSKSEGQAQGDSQTTYTWLQVRPAGDEYTVACHMAGSYSFNVGDLVVLNGDITG